MKEIIDLTVSQVQWKAKTKRYKTSERVSERLNNTTLHLIEINDNNYSYKLSRVIRKKAVGNYRFLSNE